MATMITSECINCGACEPECPNTAIYQGGVEWQAPDGSMHAPLSNDIFYIVPEKCTECVGFHDQEACAAVCPVDCCVPNPDIPETHDVLLARARTLHPGEAIPDDAQIPELLSGFILGVAQSSRQLLVGLALQDKCPQTCQRKQRRTDGPPIN